MSDWTGNGNSIYKTLGASNHTDKTREPNDYYATEPKAAEFLCDLVPLHNHIWECACGEGHLAEVFKAHGHQVFTTDVVDRGYGDIRNLDFLSFPAGSTFCGDIITNPPYKYAQEFVEKAIRAVSEGYYIAMFLKLQFLEGKKRRELFENYPPKFVFVSSSRLICAKNGEFEKCPSSAIAYAWFVWEKGYRGDTVVRWFN